MSASALHNPTALATRWPLVGFVQRLYREKPLGAAGGAVFLFFLALGLCADLLAPYGANETHILRRLESPSAKFWFGTDHLGRDLFSRILIGARISMSVGFLAAAFATALSVAIGLLSGYVGGKVDMVIQRMVDAWMTFPDLVLLIVVVAIVGPGTAQIVFTLSLIYGIAGSRIVRGAVITVRETTYTRASQSMGATTLHIMFRHILPNVMPVVIVLFSTRVGLAILAEAGLSFLGLGVPPPSPTWGGMLSGDGRSYMYSAPWLVLAPGLCLTLVVYAINVYGDALRDLLDPRMRGSR